MAHFSTFSVTTRWTRADFFRPLSLRCVKISSGGTVGGPVYLPKLYNGKNRTFFFSNYEGLRIRQQSFGSFIVPTDAQRAGDLSHSFAGALLATPILDPTNGVPFAGNSIPA